MISLYPKTTFWGSMSASFCVARPPTIQFALFLANMLKATGNVRTYWLVTNLGGDGPFARWPAMMESAELLASAPPSD